MRDIPTPPTQDAEFEKPLLEHGREPGKQMRELLWLLAGGRVEEWREINAPETLPFSHFNVPPVGYETYLRRKTWRVIRLRVLERDRNECQTCLTPQRATEVHHRSYHPHVLEGLRDDYLISLCKRCHRYVEGIGERRRTEMFEAEARINNMLAIRRELPGG